MRILVIVPYTPLLTKPRPYNFILHLAKKHEVYLISFEDIVDEKLKKYPDYEILKIQRMPPHLAWFWDDYPNYVLIYGTSIEAEANKIAAERFQEDYLGNLSDIIKADTDVNRDDLKNKCIILFGRPATNKIYQQFGDIFPIKFDHNKFAWQGITYDQPTQGVAQIVRNPNTQRMIILYAGLSEEATQNFCDLYLYDTNASYVIFESVKKLISGDWEDFDSNLVWHFNSNLP